MKDPFAKYFRTRACIRPLSGQVNRGRHYGQVVVIPALAESEHLPVALAAIAGNSWAQLHETLVVVVVNNRARAVVGVENPSLAETEAGFLDNQLTLERLPCWANEFDLHLGWVDASSPGLELPAGAGVGLARKIGCDTALQALAEARSTPAAAAVPRVLFQLDADTLVEPSYLEVGRELVAGGQPGGVIPFRHQPAAGAAAQAAIDAYELYLHHYVTGLAWAGSPYAYHTVGSAICSTAGGYVRAGGMPAKRQAGEDFYFLQQLAKTGGVLRLSGTTVHPSARAEVRAPFGTGPNMVRALQEHDWRPRVFDCRCFSALRELLLLVGDHRRGPIALLLDTIQVDPVRQFLVKRDIGSVWERFREQYRNHEAFGRAFAGWFDALATYKLLNHLADTVWPKRDLLTGWQELLERQCVSGKLDSVPELLACLRLQS